MSATVAFAESPATKIKKNSQFGFVNFLKAAAAQLIVLHHLAFYGPMADHVQAIAPELIDWLSSYARIAVQVFLVIGGFLAAKSLCPDGMPGISHPLRAVARRYVKLVPPFLIATLLTIGASAWAGLWMTHDSISASPDLLQLAAHGFLLHGIFEFESISAGAWYVAIDFQLYAALTILLWLSARLAGRRTLRWLMPVLIVLCVGASLLYFNRDSDWDVWAPYFFASYGLGILAWWSSDPARRPLSITLLLTAIVLLTTLALMIDFRSRIAVALVIACSLILLGRARLPISDRSASFINRMGEISYSVFLIHFPVCLIVNAAFSRFVPAQPHLQALGMLLAWAASLVAGMTFHRWVELPLHRLVDGFGQRRL